LPWAVKKSNAYSSNASFNRIQIEGDINVELYTDNRTPRVILHGQSANQNNTNITTDNGLLLIRKIKSRHSSSPITVEIHTHYLNSLTYRGHGNIIGHQLQSKLMDLSIDNDGRTSLEGNMILRNVSIKGHGETIISGVHGHIMKLNMIGYPRIQLTGEMDINALDLTGHGWISIFWVQSKVLKIHAADHVSIQMAGRVELLDIELWDFAHFNGRYLRGNTVFAKTHGRSIADISVIRTQHTLASDSSNIYFYNIPVMKADFMAYNGSVLDMREWESPFLTSYSHLNH
jgi:hypothetical protein